MKSQHVNFKRQFEGLLASRLQERLNFIQVVLGPRQVGKTTGVQSVFSNFSGPKHFASADSPVPHPPDWLKAQWERGIALGEGALLVIDEVQKVQGWAEVCKLMFDEHRSRRALKVVLLGSASLALEDGLASALAGRFEHIPVTHWNFMEMQEAFGWSLDTFLKYGGYPAAAELVSSPARWQAYVRDSIIEPVLGRDISGLVRIAKPSLFKQTFRLAMNYPAQVISYQKLLGQLQEGGNASTVKHYLELLEGAFLIKLIEKFSGSTIRTSSSSPKIVPLAPALCSAMLDQLHLVDDPSWRGRIIEAVVGSELVKLPGKLFYWSEGNFEVDYVRVVDGEIIAYEVKSRATHKSKSVALFKKRFPEARIEYIDTNHPLIVGSP